MADQDRVEGVVVVGGVDTHRDAHVGAVADTAGRLLGSAQFEADTAGYEQLVTPMVKQPLFPSLGRGRSSGYGC